MGDLSCQENFPSTKIEALTMLYLQKQDLSSLSPEEFLDKYEETYCKIDKYYIEKHNEPTVVYV